MNGRVGDDRYYCRRCTVTFRERFSRFYDVTSCPACRASSVTVTVLAGAPVERPSHA